jgi:hypothetical protein
MADENVVKTFTLMMRKDGASHEDFMIHWLEVHALRARDIPGLKALVCLEILQPPRPAPDAPPRRSHLPAPTNPIEVDGAIECQMTAQALASPAAKAWFTQLADFVGAAKTFLVQETVFIAPVRGGRGLMGLLKRKADWSHDDFVHHWNDVHGSAASQVPEVGGFATNAVLGEIPQSAVPEIDGFGEVDGVAQSWHRRPGTPVTSEQGQRWYADGTHLIGEARGFFTQEHVVVAPA